MIAFIGRENKNEDDDKKRHPGDCESFQEPDVMNLEPEVYPSYPVEDGDFSTGVVLQPATPSLPVDAKASTTEVRNSLGQ